MEPNTHPIVKVTPKKEALKDVPSMIGVYLFMQKGRPIYVGKATNLKARLTSHFEGARIDVKEAKITEEADEIHYIVTNSDFKALILESQLIKKHQPRYNVRWKDGKSYLYIKVTVKDEYPKVYSTRKEFDTKSAFFGPFPSNASVNAILKEIRKIFPFCTQKKMGKRACFYSKIGLCVPCPNDVQSLPPLQRTQQKRLYRKNIRRVIQILEGKTDSILNGLYSELDELTEKQRYEEAIVLRNKILRFERLISDQAHFRIDAAELMSEEDKLRALQKLLTPFFPILSSINRIECYDISNLGFKNSTASMVVAEKGFLSKSHYRKFKIKNLKLVSDFEMLEETMRRRFKNTWKEPNLIVIDGGKPQIRTVLRTLYSLGKTIPVVGLAKNPDRLIIGTGELVTIRPALNNPGFSLLRLLRDESHRFARKYHLQLRSQNLPG